MTKFLFIIPRLPTRLRNSLRTSLYLQTLRSLKMQKSKNWKAIIIGDQNQNKDENDTRFIYIQADDFLKTDKLKIAINYLNEHPEEKPEYIIRLDSDDLINENYLYDIENLDDSFDLYYYEYHICMDPIYKKISYRKNSWIANTAIHKFEYAMTKCGPYMETLFFQDHDLYWHHFYKNKKTYKSPRQKPLYYRVLSPFTLTSSLSENINDINWNKYLIYLNSYGPWISEPNVFRLFKENEEIEILSSQKPKKNSMYWIYNKIKNYKNLINDTLIPITTNYSRVHSIDLHNRELVTCSNCILNSRDTIHIEFDEKGICNYCNSYHSEFKKLGSSETRTNWLNKKISEIKSNKNTYNCLVGVSGGVDSSYLIYWAKINQLNPLVVHVDNGWNSELAVKNIENICKTLNLELQTYVINWNEFKNLQLAYLKSGVIDIEVLTDHAIYATLLNVAKKYKINYILSGYNLATEAIMPKSWVFDKTDWENIKDINSKFGKNLKVKTYPHINFYKKLYYHWFLKIETIQVLNYITYNKEDAKKLLIEKLGWRDYGGKHFESTFTKFYQSYILPVKFGIDKRRAHLSTLICSGQITKKEALNELDKKIYHENSMEEDKKYVLKKLELSETEFDCFMKENPRSHLDFKTEKKMWNRYFKIVKCLKLNFR